MKVRVYGDHRKLCFLLTLVSRAQKLLENQFIITTVILSETQIEKLAPKPTAFKAGQKLSSVNKWNKLARSERALWGEIKGSGSKPYLTEVDLEDLAFKCSCPSRQFPCKHAIAILLVRAQLGDQIATETEPDWVQDWLDKRREKATKPKKEEKDYTPEEQEQLAKGKAKRQESRMAKVNAGVLELERWLEDLIRVGLLDLPNRPTKDFETMTARMVDAQATGLASWIRALGQLSFGEPDKWQKEAMTILGKLFGLIQSWKNYPHLSPAWQESLKNLLGWSQSPKELKTDLEALAIKDDWIVLGQEKEQYDSLEVERTWLWGSESNQSALILHFGNTFAPIANPLIPGTILPAQLAFFPAVLPQRAVLRMQNGQIPALKQYPKLAEDGLSLLSLEASQLAINPWLNNQAYLLAQSRLIREEEDWYLLDQTGKLIPIVSNFPIEKLMYLLALLGADRKDMALVLRNRKALPLGLFNDRQYISL